MIDPEAVEVEFAHQHRRAADEQLAHDFFPVARRVARRHVVDVAAVTGGRLLRVAPRRRLVAGIIVGPPLVPVIDIAFGRGGIVGPLRPLAVVGVVVVDHVQQHGDAAPVAFAHEVLELVAAAAGVFDGQKMRGAVTPVGPALEFGRRHQLDAVHAEIDQIIQKVDGFGQGAARDLARAQSVDMQFVNHQIVDAGRQRPIGIELVAPKFILIGPIGFRPDRIAVRVQLPKRARDPFGIDHYRAAFRPVQVLAGAVPRRFTGFGGIGVLAATADLAAGIEVGAIGDRAVLAGDAEQVGGVIETGETRQFGRVADAGGPDAILISVHRNNGGDAAPVVPDIAARRFAAHQLHVARVRRPHRKADGRRGLTGDEQLVRAEQAAMGQVIAFGLAGGAQGETAVALGRIGVADFGGDGPGVGALRRVRRHAPAEVLTDLTVVELDRGPERGAAVLGGERLHRRRAPRLRARALGVPVARQAGVAQQRLPQSSQILEPHGNQCHEKISLSSFRRMARRSIV